jgi:myo-inositol-1(or 4)-monophosphatase
VAASFLETGMEIAREAGSLQLQFLERRVGFQLKGEYDLVTECDRASEELIVERLRTHFPSHAIVAEEGGGTDHASSEYRWFVDPLDGTTNFAHSYPNFNVTMGLEHKGEIICGVVYDPNRNEMFAAERGGGAYLNNRRIHVSKTSTLADSLLSTGFPSRRRHENINIHFYYQLAMLTHGVRRGGAAAIDLAYVACGRLDGFWEFTLNPWDMAAGSLLVEEAGGKCTDMNGGPFNVRGPHLLTTNGAIHAELAELFVEIFENRPRFPLPLVNR